MRTVGTVASRVRANGVDTEVPLRALANQQAGKETDGTV